MHEAELIMTIAVCTSIAMMTWHMVKQEEEIRRLRDLIRSLAIRMEKEYGSRVDD